MDFLKYIIKNVGLLNLIQRKVNIYISTVYYFHLRQLYRSLMSQFYQKYSSQRTNYVLELQEDNRIFETEKETLFRQFSAQIGYLIRQLSKLGGFFEEESTNFYSLKRDSDNWTTSTEKSKEQIFRTAKLTLKRQNQQRERDQFFRQKLDQAIERQFLLEEKIFVFIKKVQERKQKYQKLLQIQNQLKQRDDLIRQLQKIIEQEKNKYKTQLQIEVNKNEKLQKNKIESQYNSKLLQIKQEYDEKLLKNLQKYQSIVMMVQKEKDKIFYLMEEEISALQKNYQQRINDHHKINTPEKTRKVSLEPCGKFKNSTPQKAKLSTSEKINTQNEQKIQSLNQNLINLEQIIKKQQTQKLKLKEQNSKLMTKLQCHQIKNKEQMNRIQQKELFISEKSQELNKIYKELQVKKQAYQKLEKIVKSHEAKIANLAEELRRSKKSSQEIRELSTRNIKNMEKQNEDLRRQLIQNKKAYLNLTAQFDTIKHQIKQKQIRIQSMDRQLQRTKNYNEILTKQNLTLRQNLQEIALTQGNTNLLKIPKLWKQHPKDLQSPRSEKQPIIPQLNLQNHSKSFSNMFENVDSPKFAPQGKPRINTTRLNRIHQEQLVSERRLNSLGKNLTLPLDNLKNSLKSNQMEQSSSCNQGNMVFNYDSFETTFSPFVSPNVSETEGSTQNSLALVGATSNILSWNPQSPINQMQSLYNSVSSLNHETPSINILKSEEIIEKIASLSKQKLIKQKNINNNLFFGGSSLVFEKMQSNSNRRQLSDCEKQEEKISLPRLRPLSRGGFQTFNDGVQSASFSQDRVLNLSFEQNSTFINRSGVFNKKDLTSSGRLDAYRGRKNLN